MQQAPLTPKQHLNADIPHAPVSNNDWFAYHQADRHLGYESAGPSNSYNDSAEQYETTNRVQLERNRSVRSEICISPSWSRNEERRQRKKDLKRLAKEQKELDKKLRREAKGKPREPRRLTKAGPSSRTSSAHSHRPRFSSASSIRSFWSGRTSRASSDQDLTEWDRPMGDPSSHADGITRKYKFLGVFPRRVSGISLSKSQGMPQSDNPAPTLHPTRKISDLRASAKAFAKRESPVRHPHRQGHRSAGFTTRDNRDMPEGERVPERHRFSQPNNRTLESSPIPNTHVSVNKMKKPANSLKATELDHHQLSRHAERILRSQPAHAPPIGNSEEAHLRKIKNEQNKPGNFSDSSFYRKSPLDSLAAKAASIISERDVHTSSPSKEGSTSPIEPAMDEPLPDAVVVNTVPNGETNDKQNIGSNNDAYNNPKRPATTSLDESGPSVITPVLPSDQGPPLPVSVTPSPNPQPDIETLPEDADGSMSTSTAEPGPGPSLAAKPSSSHVVDNGRGSEPWRKPTAAHIRDSNFQSSPLAGPPLVPQVTNDTTERMPPNVPEKDERFQSHRPTKLRRRSTSSTRSQVTTSLGTYFPRLWGTGKKGTKGANNDEQDNASDNAPSAVRQGKRPVHVVNGSNDSSSSQSQPGSSNGAGQLAGKANRPALSSVNLPTTSSSPIPRLSRRSASDSVQIQQLRAAIHNSDTEKRPFSTDVPSRMKLGSAYARNGTGNPSLRDLIIDETLMTTKGTYSNPSRSRHMSSSSVLSAGSLGQRTQKKGLHGGQTIGKMFVICCQCKFWHDMPSEAYANLAFPQGAPDTNAPPAATRDGVPVSTSVNCCWCCHKMSRTCCAGWTAIVNLRERHH